MIDDPNAYLEADIKQTKISSWTKNFYKSGDTDDNNRDRINAILCDAKKFSNFVQDLISIKDEQDNELKTIIGSKIKTASNFIIANEILKTLQKEPKYVSSLIEYAYYYNTKHLLSNSKYYKQLILYAMSSFYSKDRVDIKKKIDALADLQKIFALINNDEFSFEEIINTIIYHDYACGNEEREIFLDKKEHNEEANSNTDFKKIIKIIKSQNLINDNIKNSPDVLAFYQNIKNNKLYFSANIKNTDFENKTLTEVIFEKFSNNLSKNSIQRLISTLGFSEPVFYTKHNKFQENLYNGACLQIASNYTNQNKERKKKTGFLKDITDTIESIFGDSNQIHYNNDKITIDHDNTSVEKNIKDKRYKICSKSLIDKIANCKNFKQIDLKYKILVDKRIKSTFSKIESNDLITKNLEEVFFEKFKTENINTIKNITNIEQFESLKEENIEKIIDSLVKIDFAKDIPFNQDETSCIIETAKRLYFHKNASDDGKKKIIKYIVDCLKNSNNLSEKNLIGNSLIIDTNKPRTENGIIIEDYVFLEQIIQNINNILQNELNNDEQAYYMLKQQYCNSFSSAINNITSARVLVIIMQNQLFTKKKIIQETLEILRKKESNLIYFWETNKDAFIKNVLSYINLPINDNYDDNLNTLKLIAKEQYGISTNLLSKKINNNLVKEALLVKTLADGISYIDFNGIYGNIKNLVKEANAIYNNVHNFNSIEQKEYEKLSNIKIDLKKHVLDELKKCRQNIKNYMIKAPNNKDLITRKEILHKLIKFIEFQIENQAIDKISNGTYELYGLAEHFKKIRDEYNNFVNCYNDEKTLKKYNDEQNSLMMNTKKQLTNGIKAKIIKKQKEWKEIFEKYKDVDNNSLKNFFENYYNDIDGYAYQTLECIEKYNGNDIESLQKQIQINIEKLEEKVNIFDSKIQKSINIAEKYNENITISSKKGSNIANAVINYNNDNFQKSKKAEHENVSNFLQKSKDNLLNDVVSKNDNKKFLFDKKQTFIASFGFSTSTCLGLAGIMTGNPIFIAIGGFICASDIICLIFRKNQNNKINESNNFNLQQKLYEHAFIKKTKQKDDEKKKKNKDNNKEDDNEEKKEEKNKDDEEQKDDEKKKKNKDNNKEDDNEEKRKDIKNTNTTDLKNAQQQQELL